MPTPEQTLDELDAIGARAAAATPGPWRAHAAAEKDAIFIAHAREDVLNLEALVRWLRARAEKAERDAESVRLALDDEGLVVASLHAQLSAAQAERDRFTGLYEDAVQEANRERQALDDAFRRAAPDWADVTPPAGVPLRVFLINRLRDRAEGAEAHVEAADSALRALTATVAREAAGRLMSEGPVAAGLHMQLRAAEERTGNFECKNNELRNRIDELRGRVKELERECAELRAKLAAARITAERALKLTEGIPVCGCGDGIVPETGDPALALWVDTAERDLNELRTKYANALAVLRDVLPPSKE